MKRRVTRKPIFATPKDMMRAVNAYFDTADENETPYTVSGLCLHIGMSRESFLSNKYDPIYADVIDQAKLLLQQQHEINLLTHRQTKGTVFALKNLGWSDKASLDVGVSGGDPANPESLKWTIEVVAPEPKIKSEPKQLPQPSEESLFT